METLAAFLALATGAVELATALVALVRETKNAPHRTTRSDSKNARGRCVGSGGPAHGDIVPRPKGVTTMPTRYYKRRRA